MNTESNPRARGSEKERKWLSKEDLDKHFNKSEVKRVIKDKD